MGPKDSGAAIRNLPRRSPAGRIVSRARSISAQTRAAHSPLGQLTPREREVLAEMAQGKNNAAIARALVLTPRAIEKHINAIFSKLPLNEEVDVDRRVKAVLLYLSEQA